MNFDPELFSANSPNSIIADPLAFLCRLYNEFLLPGGLLYVEGFEANIKFEKLSNSDKNDATTINDRTLLGLQSWAYYLREQFDCRVSFRKIDNDLATT